MTESMHDYMKVGLIHFMAYPQTMKGEGPIEDTIKKILVDDYFDAIEITKIKDASVRARVASMLSCSHMAVAYGGQPRLLTTGMNINDLNEGKRIAAVENLQEGIDEAWELGASAFAFLSGNYEESTKEESYRSLVKSTTQICDYAKNKGGMGVALEVFDYDVDKKSLIGPAGLAREFAEEIRGTCDNFGLMVDLSHIPLLHETIEESLYTVKDYIVHAHMGNCVSKCGLAGYGDQHPRFGFPGSDSDVRQLADYLKALLDIGFLNKKTRPIVSFEVKPFGDEDSDIVVANAKRTLNAAWSSI